ncbi:Mitochondrial genome maintenance protein MGM101 [Colletotrichum sp. SAR 10_99]|nr:Mitochondrial genome maintenance protein MGM101 [Colletotrichum sp. SAR 10_99]
MIPAMASQQALRPLLRLTRPATQIARITTTTRTKAAAAATATAPKPAPKPAVSRAATPIVKKPYTKPAPKPPSPPPPPPPATPEADAAIGPSLSSSTPLPTAPFDNGNGNGNGNVNGSEDGNGNGVVDWTRSYYGLGTARFPKEVVDILLQPVNPADVEVKPDGIIYLPEIKYRRILNQAFGPGGWGLVPKGEVVVGERIVTREYALIAEGRFISQAQGENGYFNVENLPSAVEGCKSNALMRCCKDLGIASDLWDPVFIRAFKKEYALEVWCEHVTTGKKKLVWTRKDVPIAYPFKKTQ